MRWDDLFEDLEAEASGLVLIERDADIADRTRVELARIRLLDRCVAARGQTVHVDVRGSGQVRGRLDRVTPLWLLVLTGELVEHVVSLAAVLGVSGLSSGSAAPGSEGAVVAATTWAQTWRVLARDRAEVQVVRTDGSLLRGVVTRPGADFVELAAGAGTVLVPYAAIAVIRCPRPAG